MKNQLGQLCSLRPGIKHLSLLEHWENMAFVIWVENLKNKKVSLIIIGKFKAKGIITVEPSIFSNFFCRIWPLNSGKTMQNGPFFVFNPLPEGFFMEVFNSPQKPLFQFP